jgi:plasmid stabilization system protein ParE
MTYRVEFSVRALLDLEVLYFEKNVAESRAAARWFNGLQDAIEGLATLPNRCSLAPEAKGENRELRHLLYGKKPHIYRVIYEVDESRQMVKVFHICYGARRAFKVSEIY